MEMETSIYQLIHAATLLKENAPREAVIKQIEAYLETLDEEKIPAFLRQPPKKKNGALLCLQRWTSRRRP